MIKVLDNVIPVRFQDHMIALMDEITWTWHSNTSYFNDATEHMNHLLQTDPAIIDNGQFVNPILDNKQALSPDIGLMIPLLYCAADKAEIPVNEILRIKINMLMQDKTFTENNYNFPHTDIRGSKTFVYYINDSDGDTVLFNEFANGGTFTPGNTYCPDKLNVVERVSPKKGRGVFFESSRFHASSNPAKHKCRYVINFNFI